MNTLRYMIHRLKGQIFETRMFYFNCSKDMSIDSFRKYVSRLVEEKELIPVAKGIYYIGNQLPENIGELVQEYYLSDTGACYGGETLLYYLGISEKEPKEVVILNSHISSNKNIWNMIIKTPNDISMNFYYDGILGYVSYINFTKESINKQ